MDTCCQEDTALQSGSKRQHYRSDQEDMVSEE